MTAPTPPDRAWLPPVAPDEARIPAANVGWAVAVVERTGLVAEIESWTRKTTGRPQTEITVEGVLVSLLLLAVETRPLLLNNVEAVAYRRIPAEFRQRFRTDKPTVTDKQRQAAYKNVRDQFHRICRSMDPSPLPKNRRLLWFELQAAAEQAALSPEQETEMVRRLRLVTSRLLQATFEMLPREVRRRWKGSVAVDGTQVPVFAVGRDYDGVWESTDPDAGWHTRQPGVEAHGIAAGEKPPSKSKWAYEATIATMGYDQPLRPPTAEADGTVVPGDPVPHPLLALGLELHRPATHPGRHAVDVLTAVRDPGRPLDPDEPPLPAGWLGVDRAFNSGSRVEDFHEPVRALGYRPVMDYKTSELGARGQVDGAMMVEGHLYCLSMPAHLVNASVDFREGRIDDRQYAARVAERAAYLFRRKDRLGADRTRWMCPASGTCPTAACRLKRPSLVPVGLAPVEPDPVLAALGSTPKACSQTSITIADSEWAKYRQALRYQSPEWRAVYGSLRNTVEGFNGTVKDGNGAALDDPARRRVRGLAPQWLLVLFMLVGENVRRIRAWQQRADAAEGGQPLKVRRAERRAADRARWQAEKEQRLKAGLPVHPEPTTAAQKKRARKRKAAEAEADG